MNKKIVIIILAVVCVLSVVVIGIYGNATNNRNTPISVKGVSFIYENCKYELNEQNEPDFSKPYYELIISDENPTLAPFQLKWEFDPVNATNKDVTFTTSNIASVNNEGLVTFNSSAITSDKTVIVKITTKDGSKQSTIKFLIKYQKESSIGGDLRPGGDQFD